MLLKKYLHIYIFIYMMHNKALQHCNGISNLFLTLSRVSKVDVPARRTSWSTWRWPRRWPVEPAMEQLWRVMLMQSPFFCCQLFPKTKMSWAESNLCFCIFLYQGGRFRIHLFVLIYMLMSTCRQFYPVCIESRVPTRFVRPRAQIYI